MTDAHPPPLALMRLSLCLARPKLFPTQGVCMDTHASTHPHMCCLCVCITHACAGTVIHPNSPQGPSTARPASLYSQVELKAGGVILQKRLATGLVGLSGVLQPVSLPTLRGWHCPCGC